MLRWVFVGTLVLHGMIHAMGFAQAFNYSNLPRLPLQISKPFGLLWLLASILCMTAALLYLNKKEWWWYFGILTVLVSQVLILVYWKDAKFGTLLNIVLFAVAIASFANQQFHKKVAAESQSILQSATISPQILKRQDIEHLPDIVQKWMEVSNVIGKRRTVKARLKQVGVMKMKPDSDWLPFVATQYVNLETPSFVWMTNVDFHGINLVGRDKLQDGESEMLIKLASLVPVVQEGHNTKINTGAMVRFLAEICWFPSAAINEYISWEAVDSSSARATLNLGGTSVSGIFNFNNNGTLKSFEANRFYGGSQNAKSERWVVIIEDYKSFKDISIPYKSNVSWKLPTGDFNWLKLEITHLEYNIGQLYSR